MSHSMVPELDEVLDSEPVQHYAFETSFEEAKDDPWLILHTSGSTGLPKPITYTHAAVAAIDAQSIVPPLSEDEAKIRGYQRRRWADVFAEKFTSPFAYYHTIWAIPTLVFTIFWGSTFVFSARDTHANTQSVLEAMKVCDMAWLPPSLLDDIARSDGHLQQLSRLKHIVYTGGT